MPEKTEYAPGTPSWVDLATPDVDKAGTFYATLFGWTAEPVPMPDAGGYVMFTLNGKYVAAMAPIEHGERPPAWTTYVSTDDADKTAELAQTAGPTGAAFAVWQPNQHPGAGLVDDPGTFTWAELSSRDTAAATRFYPEVFGWTAETSDGGGMQYTEFKLGDSSVAGMMEMNPMVPAEVPSYWMPYFAVVDVDKSAGEATALGAEALLPPSDFPGGRFAVIRDPQGAAFGLLRLSPKS
jgi:predicted enzyme related to lactoylglutathione lyase